MAQPLWTLLAILALHGATANKPQPGVEAPAGRFRGKVLTSHSGVDYASYRGIPYALAPTGDRRFALPEPHPAIEGMHDAGEFGPICLQNWRGHKLGREDCLYLNVYTPLDGQTATDADLKKVLVFIHGGGFVVGSSNPYLPGDLVTRGDLVVVTFNYRLNWMGFLRGNSSSLPGNVAYWDQLSALKWVKDNIKYFRGDPSDVTLSGESAGSMSTSLLSLSPEGKGLFTRVMLLSGAFPFAVEPPRTSNDLLQVAASRFGCSVDSLPGHEDDVVTCLKQVPSEDFINKFEFEILLLGTSSGDTLIPRPLLRAMSDSNFLREIGFFDRDYLVSVTADEGYLLINSIFGKMDTTSIDSIAHDIFWRLNLPEDIAKLVILEYQKLFKELEKSTIVLLGDSIFLKNSLNFLDTIVSRRKNDRSVKSRSVHLMSFDHAPKYVPNHYMLHALDLSYLFDLTPKDLITSFYFLEPEGEFDDDDLEMKADYIDLVTDFVKTGNPGERLTREKGVVWRPYDTEHKSYLSLSLLPSGGEDLLGARRVIWDKLVPQWLEEKMVAEKKEEL